MKTGMPNVRGFGSQLGPLAKALILVVAGAGSFWFAMHMAPSAPAADNADVELAKPGAGIAHVEALALEHGNGASSTSIAAASTPPPAAAASRLAPTMMSNPFGPLNVFASQNDVLAQAQTTPSESVNRVVYKSHVRSPTPPSPLPLPTVAAPPPAPPVAPALPFVLLGAIQSGQITGGNTVAFLKYGNGLVVAHGGDTIDTKYKVVSISPDLIEFVYLPLNTKQTLNIAH